MSTGLGERYRKPSRLHRIVAIVVVGALVASGLGFLGWVMFEESTPEVTSQLNAFSFPEEHRAVADITVARRTPFTEATCQLVAVAADFAVVGEQTLRVVDGPQRQTLRVEIRTERAATSVQLKGCTAPGQSRPR